MNKKGFTLIELMIAVLIFSVVATAIYAVFSTGIIAWKKAEQSVRLYQDGRLVLNNISKELKNALLYSDIQFSGQTNELSFSTLLSSPEERNLRRIYRVAYYLDEEEVLRYRRETLRQFLQSEDQPAQALLGSVEKINFAYAYDYQEEGDTLEFVWQDEWTDLDILPYLVKVSLVLSEGITLTKTIHLPTGVKRNKEEEI